MAWSTPAQPLLRAETAAQSGGHGGVRTQAEGRPDCTLMKVRRCRPNRILRRVWSDIFSASKSRASKYETEELLQH